MLALGLSLSLALAASPGQDPDSGVPCVFESRARLGGRTISWWKDAVLPVAFHAVIPVGRKGVAAIGPGACGRAAS